ncbi:MAG: class I SAM-dependent rRNA methyltransferase, partial [Desulfomonilaceae bacterium]
MIRLKKQADRKVRRGYLWIFSNEIQEPHIKDLSPGGIYDVTDFSGEFLGVAYANPKSLIAARILSRKKTKIDQSFVISRLQNALDLRSNYCRDREAFRVFFGEADLIPGLVIDKFGSHLVIQSSTTGIDGILDLVVEAVDMTFNPQSIVLRNDSSMRSLEGIPVGKEIRKGTGISIVKFQSYGLFFVADLINGQKTGFFLDQEFNRPLLHTYLTRGASVLD